VETDQLPIDFLKYYQGKLDKLSKWKLAQKVEGKQTLRKFLQDNRKIVESPDGKEKLTTNLFAFEKRYEIMNACSSIKSAANVQKQLSEKRKIKEPIPKKQYTDEQKKQALELRSQGKTWIEVKDITGVPDYVVRHYQKKHEGEERRADSEQAASAGDTRRVVNVVRGFLKLVDNDYLRDLGDIRELADLCQSFNEVVLENNQIVVDQAERLKAEYLETVSEKYCLEADERYALEKVVTFACNCHLEFSINVTSMPASFNQRYHYQIMVNEYLEYNSKAVKDLLEKTAIEAKQQGETIKARRKDSTFHTHPVPEATSEASSMEHIGHWEGPPQEDIDIDEQLLVTIKNGCQDIPVIEIAGATIRGARKRQKDLHSEDRFFYHDLSFTAGKECLWGIITGVIDGHGGGNAEDFVVKHFAPCLKEALEKRCQKGLSQTAIVNSLTIAMVSMNFKYSGQGGATISIILKIGEVIYTANVGDSVTVLLYENGDVVQLSADELLFSDVTCQRITDYGGEVINRPDPDDLLDRLTMIVTDSLQCEKSRNIMLSNLFGDHKCCGVLTGRPAITATNIGQWREAGIMGWLHFTDGVTEVASASDAGRWVIHKLQEKEAGRDAVTSLVRQCSVAKSPDDITAVLCTFG
ncbi:protein phosphatase 1K, mitochondrial, partial [Elysia marginata]